MLKKLNPKTKAGCGVGCVFGLGFFAGIVAMFIFVVVVVQRAEGWKAQESKDFVASHFANKLEMTEEQRAKFQPIVDEVLEKRWQMRREYFEENRAVIEEYLPRVNEFLDEEQQKKARQLYEKWWKDNAFKIEKEGKPKSSETG